MNSEKTNAGPVRINRFLAQCGLGSRRACERLVEAGKVFVNGRKVSDLGTRVDPSVDKIEYKGATLEPVRAREYFAYHKPAGPVVTKTGQFGSETIFESISNVTDTDLSHLNYAGRLDMDSEGLLILTNDGDLIYRVTHPRFHVKKVYHVKTTKPLAAADARVMTGAGVESDGQTLRALSIKPLDGAAEDREGHWSEIELGEGRKRHIRRMLEGGGYAVVRLKRVRFGPVRLEGLSPGAIRPLTDREIDALRAVGHRIKEAGR